MRVKDFMTSPALTVRANAPLAEAVAVMCDQKVSALVVVDEHDRLAGVLSESDLMHRIELGTGQPKRSLMARLFDGSGDADRYRSSRGRKVRDVMTPSPITVNEHATLETAAALMDKHGIKRLPVISNDRLAGVLSRSDFVRALRAYLVGTSPQGIISSDDEIEARLLSELNSQSWARGCDIKITVADGEVRAFGNVATEDQRRAVRVAAETMPGVKSFDDRIEVAHPAMMPSA